MSTSIGDRAAALRAWVAELPQRHPWVERCRRTMRHYYAHRGNHLALAVAFATVLAAVPLLMILFSGAAYVLWWRASLVTDLETWLLGAVPRSMRELVRPAIDTAIGQRVPVGSIGMLATLWAGMTWMSVVREAVSAMWGLPPLLPASPRRVLRDLRALLLLVTAALSSFVLVAASSALIGSALDLFGLADAPVVRWLLVLGGALSGLAINWVALMWVLARLPGLGTPYRAVAGPAAAGALAFEVLTVATTVTVGAASSTVSGALFGTVLTGLVFLFATSRILLMLAAWTALSAGAGLPGQTLGEQAE
ncbi:membrane protein [Pseudonocardia thermophila]|uniref:Membrane protein n=1 Tax=Pseudonocardia thermophila TaxID=1848 RepID=A0A1M7ACJ3_PSETH|nr:YhjD/YihY/BrkB family envelope integrity protein [Pseudonocardia thermophila]SHL40481.1 membrane protein [Pseudonocardia thermophila]